MAKKEDIQLVLDYLKTIYTIDNDIGTLPDSLSKVKRFVIRRWNSVIKEIENWPQGKKSKQFEWRITSLMKHLKFMRESEDNYEDYDKYVEQFNDIIEKHLPRVAGYNARRYDIYKRTAPNPVSLEEVIAVNKKYDGKYIIGSDITAVMYSIVVPKNIKDKIIAALPKNPWDAYPAARAMHRHFIIHVGGTNTGKTYQSLERLKSVDSGAYLGPLRLLAMEVYEKLNKDGVPCNLLTGEQEDNVPGATHVASTIEMADYSTKYDVVVIDECQMMDDRERGGNWTEAIMGMLSGEIHLCTAPIALDLCKKIIKDCGDTYEVVEHERFVPLEPQIRKKDNFNLTTDLQNGDALIVFSRRAVLNLAEELSDAGIGASVIYGALPYETRKKQVERFTNKLTRVVVSTDAIGMGLNLPIHRIIFMETSKYDGETVRQLKQEEIKQIAGRAGRRGMYTEGYVTAITPADSNFIKKNIESAIELLELAHINFPESLISLDAPLAETLSVWAALKQDSPYTKQSVDRILKLISILGVRLKKSLSDKELYDICTVPFDDESAEQVNQWRSYISQYIKQAGELKRPDEDCALMSYYGDKLRGYEEYYKELGLYFGFAKKMGMSYDKDWLNKELVRIADKINQLLISEIKNKRKRCRVCGKLLPWNYQYGMCEKCYGERQIYRDSWDDYF